jgi:hypothetical protein
MHSGRAACAIVTSLTIAAMDASPVAAQALEASVGVQGMLLKLNAVGEGAAGFGFRATLDASRVGLDGELSRFPENPSGNFGERLWLAGARIRLRGRQSRLLARARGGRIAFNGSFFDLRLSDRRHPAYDFGLTYERAASSVLFRIDVGDVIVPFGGASYRVGPQPRLLGVTHNLLVAVGFGLRAGGR